METETVFRIILPVLIITFAAHRGYHVKYHSKPEDATVKRREEGIVSKLAGLLGIVGFIALIAFVINPVWLAWGELLPPSLVEMDRRWHCSFGVCRVSMGTSHPRQ